MELWSQLADPPGAEREMWYRDSEGDVRVTWGEGAREALRFAAALRERGVEPGDRVACILTNSYQVAVAIPGVWFAGATLVSLPTIARGVEPAAYIAQLGDLCDAVGSRMLLVEQRYASLIPDPAEHRLPLTTYESLTSSRTLAPSPPGPDDVALIQYSSGSTSEPKGCLLTTRAIERQLETLVEAVEIDGRRDRGVIWLPLSHDMGLFGGLLLAWTTGMAGVLNRPERFLASPRIWFDECAAFGGTLTVGPSSALATATRIAQRTPPADLSPLRTCIVGGERVEAGVLDGARELLGRCGMAPTAPTPAYGMAEATLAVTATRPEDQPRSVSLDSVALLAGELREPADARNRYDVVSCGTPLSQVGIRIDGGGDVGEICVRSPCLADGYFDDDERTRAAFVDGELRTGDWGFVDQGELFVVGRLDDMLSVGGRNVHASPIETAIAQGTSVRSGNCAIVDVPRNGRQSLVMVAEPTRADGDDLRDVARAARQIAVSRGGVAIAECVFVPRGTFPKTPSGKVQRFRCRELVADGATPTERVALS